MKLAPTQIDLFFPFHVHSKDDPLDFPKSALAPYLVGREFKSTSEFEKLFLIENMKDLSIIEEVDGWLGKLVDAYVKCCYKHVQEQVSYV